MSDKQLKKDCENALKDFLKLDEKDKEFVRGAIWMALAKKNENKKKE